MNTTILITACIDPKGMAFTTLQNKEVRLQQYLDALNYYLYNTNLNIVFVENTGYDISGGTVKSALFNAKTRLKRLLEQ